MLVAIVAVSCDGYQFIKIIIRDYRWGAYLTNSLPSYSHFFHDGFLAVTLIIDEDCRCYYCWIRCDILGFGGAEGTVSGAQESADEKWDGFVHC